MSPTSYHLPSFGRPPDRSSSGTRTYSPLSISSGDLTTSMALNSLNASYRFETPSVSLNANQQSAACDEASALKYSISPFGTE